MTVGHGLYPACMVFMRKPPLISTVTDMDAETAYLWSTVKTARDQAIPLISDFAMAEAKSASFPAPLPAAAPAAAAVLPVPAAPPALIAHQRRWPKTYRRLQWIQYSLLLGCYLVAKVTNVCKHNQQSINTLTTADITARTHLQSARPASASHILGSCNQARSA